MGSRFRISWQLVFVSAPAVLGGLALGIMGNAVYGWITNQTGTSDVALIGIIVGTLLIVIGVVALLSFLFSRLRHVGTRVTGKKPPTPRKGLILLVSRDEPSRKALQYHWKTLKHCWLLHSNESEPIARKLKEELESAGKTAKMVHIIDVQNPLEYNYELDAVYRRLPSDMSENDVILDCTGMTALASVGSILACLNGRRPIQYTPAVYANNKPIGSGEPWEVLLAPDLLSAFTTPDAKASSSADAASS